GYVAKVNVNNGRYVAPTETLFELINPADVHVVLQAYEKDLVQLRNGQRFTAWTNSEPERKHSGTIILMSKNMSAGRSAEIHAHFDQYDPQLIPGTFLNAEIETTRRNAVLLPEAAVVHFEGRNYIFTETGNNKYEMVEVTTGAAENGKIEIITPSLAGKKTPVVISGAYTLLMALKNTAD
ncbi:MAG: efflux RND transporter periplasmic adaptor subunit, partial [Dinghuibacter sp.]|nr:efflux RND transporter periplasmic adaptor subunit [Dinghuibacter sp.]